MELAPLTQPDMVDTMLAAVGQPLSVVARHVCREWRRATHRLWGERARFAGPTVWAGSIEGHEWCESVGWNLGGWALLEAATRTHNVDLVYAALSLYAWYTERSELVRLAVEADEIELLLALSKCHWLPPPWGAGPRVSAWFKMDCPFLWRRIRLEPHHTQYTPARPLARLPGRLRQVPPSVFDVPLFPIGVTPGYVESIGGEGIALSGQPIVCMCIHAIVMLKVEAVYGVLEMPADGARLDGCDFYLSVDASCPAQLMVDGQAVELPALRRVGQVVTVETAAPSFVLRAGIFITEHARRLGCMRAVDAGAAGAAGAASAASGDDACDAAPGAGAVP
jgi:hypothetical protein